MNFTLFFLLVGALYTSASIEVNFKPNCRTCKWFLPSEGKLYEPGHCTLFSSKIDYGNAEIIVHRYAIQCRLNSFLCGIDGTKYEEKEKDKDVLERLNNEIVELEKNFNTEVMETPQIKELETEISLIKNKIDQLRRTQ
jgi:hypothetical protein